MKPRDDRSREYRVLALAAVFFVIGLIFFLRDSGTSQPPPVSVPGSGDTPAEAGVVQPGGNVTVQSATAGLVPSLAKLPAPTQFQTLRFDANGLNGQPEFTITATCHDAYLTILIFSAKFDYRADVSRAVYNKAFTCAPEQPFHKTFSKADMANVPFGTYYVIAADQGASGAWYNPR